MGKGVTHGPFADDSRHANAAGFVAEIGIALPLAPQHGNVRTVLQHTVHIQPHQLFHMALAPGLRVYAYGADVAGF